MRVERINEDISDLIIKPAKSSLFDGALGAIKCKRLYNSWEMNLMRFFFCFGIKIITVETFVLLRPKMPLVKNIHHFQYNIELFCQ